MTRTIIRTRGSIINFVLMAVSSLLSHVTHFFLSGLCEEVPKVPPDPSVCRQRDRE